MVTRSFRPNDDSMLANWESMPERAPSSVRDDKPVAARFLALVGLFLLAVGAIAVVVPQFNWRYIIGPTWGLVFATTGLALILFHAFADGEVQFRRIYALVSVFLVLAGAVTRVLPVSGTLGAWFLPFGVPAIAIGFLFMLAVLRQETDLFWRSLLLRLMGIFGFAMLALGVVFGFTSPERFAGEGVVLIFLGTFFASGFIGLQQNGSDVAYYSGLALGGIAVVTFLASLVRSWMTADYFVPTGISLMGLSVMLLGIALGICSDSALVVLVRRELAGFFFSPVAYLVLLSSMVVAAILFTLVVLSWVMMRDRLQPVFEPIVAFYLGNEIPVIIQMIIVPVLTMRLLSEEKRSGTLEMLLTAPVNETTIVLAKFIAALIFWLLTWLPYFLYLVALRVIGGETFDIRPLLAFGLALIATGGGFMAMGLFFSAITRNQIIAAVLTFVGNCLALVDWGTELVTAQMGVPALDQHAMEALRAHMDTAPVVQIPTQVSGILTLIGFVVLAIGIPRAKVGPVAAAAGLPVGVLGNILGFATGSLAVQAIGNLVLTAAMVALAWRWVRPMAGQNDDAREAVDIRPSNAPT